MSNRTNYSKISSQKVKEDTAVREPAVAYPVVEEVVVGESVVVPPAVEVEPETPVKEEVTTTTGVVVNCGKLRVRKNPSPYSAVICEIPKDTKVVVDIDKSTLEYYKVTTIAGVEGYCVKQYLAVV